MGDGQALAGGIPEAGGAGEESGAGWPLTDRLPSTSLERISWEGGSRSGASGGPRRGLRRHPAGQPPSGSHTLSSRAPAPALRAPRRSPPTSRLHFRRGHGPLAGRLGARAVFTGFWEEKAQGRQLVSSLARRVRHAPGRSSLGAARPAPPRPAPGPGSPTAPTKHPPCNHLTWVAGP